MNKKQTRKGAASIYAVVFVTLLVGIIAVSFVRLILREATDTTDNELSRSSLDAALVGVEDAKRALAEYDTNTGTLDMNDCDFVNKVLNGETASGEVLIQTTAENRSKTEQAYTCVKASDVGENYKGTLSSSNTVAVVPLKYSGNTAPNKVVFSWFEDSNTVNEYVNKSEYKKLEKQQNTPPVVSFQYVQTGSSFSPVTDFDPTGDTTTDSATLILTPTDSDSGKTSFSATDLVNSHNIGVKNEPAKVKCSKNNGFYCSVEINLPSPKGDGVANQYLVLSLPYGVPETAFQVEMKNDNTPINFDGVQYLVDSTGRANDLYTRIEVRLDIVDPNFPYPQFALQSKGAVEKNFWVTNDCKKVDNGIVTECKNSGNL
ncbi:hypothetical protein IJI94_01070 [Candidatus Saccharibacteria bacterium]|nr:hypothetical protein [Candidatus Saccharibacteria bacterium]